MISFRREIALAASFFISVAASAQQVTQDCTGCTTTQVEALATGCGQGYTYVTDFAAQKLYKVCYTWDVDDGYRPPKKYKEYTWATPESSATQLFQAYEGVYQHNGHAEAATAHVIVNIHAPAPNGDNGYMNAYDVLSSSANQNALSNYLLQEHFDSSYIKSPDPALAAAVANLLNALQINGVIKIGGFPVSFTMDFNDGSHITVTFNVATQKYEPVPGTAVDAHLNTIPQNTNMASNGGIGQTYVFNGGNTFDMGNIETVLRNLQARGIPVSNGSGGSITCTWDGTTLTCTVKQF